MARKCHFFYKMKKSIFGPTLLFIAALIWGSSFIVMKDAVSNLSPNVLLSVRFFGASILIGLWIIPQIRKLTKKQLLYGLLTGICLYSAYIVQTMGLQFTTPAKNAFLTTVYCAFVPFLVWIIYKKKPDSYNFIAALMCIAGIGFITIKGDLTINFGDILTILCGFFYAVHIMLLRRFTEEMDSILLTVLQFFFAGICALIVGMIFEDYSQLQTIPKTVYFQVFYLTFFATGLTLVCQTVGQKYTSECNASIILSLESVFGVIFSVLFYKEIVTVKMYIGFIFIFSAIVISERKPRLKRRMK